MKAKKLLAVLLAVVMIVPMFCGFTASAEESTTAGTEYDTIFIHGLGGWGYESTINSIMPYWGMFSGDMMSYLRGQGYSVYAANVGPVSSAWDRCCELFAQLTGTQVDYGAAHSARVTAQCAERGYADLVHERYGRDYNGEPLIENWGPIYDENGSVTGWYDNKINLVGHSFGGPTEVEFLNLLAEGDAEEIAWGKQQAATYGGDWHDYVSPLFWGDYDGEYLINSVTSLAGVLNGTTFISTCDSMTYLGSTLMVGIGNTIGVTNLCSLYDYHLEQFGMSKVKGDTFEAQFNYLNQKGFLAMDDQAFYDLSTAGCNELKQGWQTYDNVYYFAYAGNCTHKTITGNYLPNANTWPLFMPFSTDMGRYTNRYETILDVNGNVAGYIDNTWKPNDGMVNTVSARYPIGCDNKPYDANNIEAGIWQWCDKSFDHMGFSGGMYLPKPVTTRTFYNQIMSNIASSYGIC